MPQEPLQDRNEQAGPPADFFSRENILLGVRTALVLGELIPMAGAVAGVAGAGIDVIVNIAATAELGDGPDVLALRGFIAARQGLAGFQALTGHLSYLLQGAELLLILSPPALLLMAAINEAILLINTKLDFLGVLLDCASLAQADLVGRKALGDPQREALESLELSLGVNLVADFAAFALDLVGIATATLIQNKALQKPIEGVIRAAPLVEHFLKAAAQRVHRLELTFGSSATAQGSLGGASAEAPQSRQAQAAAALSSVRDMRAAYADGDAIMTWVRETVSTFTEQGETFITDVTGLQEPAATFGDQLANQVESMRAELDTFESAEAAVAEAGERAHEAHAALDQIQAQIDQLTLPPFEPPAPTDLGDGLLADAGEYLVDGGKALMQAAARKAWETAQGLLDDAKAQSREELERAREEVEFFETFFTRYQERLADQAQHLEKILAELSDKLDDCQNADDLLGLLADQARQLIEEVTGLSVDDLQRRWNALGPQLEQVEQLLLAEAGAKDEAQHERGATDEESDEVLDPQSRPHDPTSPHQ